MLVKAIKETRAFKDHPTPASSLQQARSNNKYNNHWCYLHRKLKPGRCKFNDDDDDDDDGDNNVDVDDDDDGRWSEWVTVALF